MLRLCPHCKRKRRCIEVAKTLNKKKYWAYLCVECKSLMALDEVEKKEKRK